MSDPSDDPADEEPAEHDSDSPDGPEVKSKKDINRRSAGILSPFLVIVAVGLLSGLPPSPFVSWGFVGIVYLTQLVSILSVLVDVRGVRSKWTRLMGYATIGVLVLSIGVLTYFVYIIFELIVIDDVERLHNLMLLVLPYSLFFILVLSMTILYVLVRRHQTINLGTHDLGTHDPSEYETTVSENWYYVIAVGVILWIIAFLFINSVPTESAAASLLGFFALFSWIAMPIATYYDIKHVRSNSKWNPDTALWIIGMLFLFIFSGVVGLVYLYKRREYLGKP